MNAIQCIYDTAMNYYFENNDDNESDNNDDNDNKLKNNSKKKHKQQTQPVIGADDLFPLVLYCVIHSSLETPWLAFVAT